MFNKPVREHHGTLSNLSLFEHSTEKLLVLVNPEQKETKEKMNNN